MRIKEAAQRLGISQRMLRHYESSGLMNAHRSQNGYRSYSEADLRRAERIRDFIATGFSTREVRAMAACLSDEGAGPCAGGAQQLRKKLAHIDQLRAELDARRERLLGRLDTLQRSLSESDEQTDPPRAGADRSHADRVQRMRASGGPATGSATTLAGFQADVHRVS